MTLSVGRQFAAVACSAAGVLLAAGCGGDGNDSDSASRTTTNRRLTVGAGSLGARLAQKPGPNVNLSFATSDYAVGENRITFAVVRPNGKLVQAPRAKVYIARSPADRAMLAGVAELRPVGPHTHPKGTAPHDHADLTDLYVIRIPLTQAGKYVLLAEPQGERIQGASEITVRTQTEAPAIGSKAFASANPTLADAPARTITTARPPDTELLRYSIKDSIAAGSPFVVAFATPKFCQSRTCGPTVDVLDKVRRDFAGTGVRFIHVEVYENNDPQRGVNQWMREWHLPTEPWVFLVDGKGIIREKFEGTVSVDELEHAVREHLAAG